MTRETVFAFPLPGGLHARPAAALRDRALAFDARCVFINDRTGARAPLGNLLGLLATDTRHRDPCRILAEGPGAELARADLADFLQGAFLACDAPGEPPRESPRAGIALRRILDGAGCAFHQGLPVAPGVGTGPAVLDRPPRTAIQGAPCADPAAASRDLHGALARVLEALRAGAALPGDPARAAVLEAQAAMLQDAEWIAVMEEGLAQGAPAAVYRGARWARARLLASGSPYLRERALDVQDLGDRLLAELGAAAPGVLELPGPCVVVAHDLTPSRLLALDRRLVRGLVLAEGAATSHTAILARNFGIPCVAGAGGPALAPGQRVTVDGDRGLVVPDPPAALEAYYGIQARERSRLPAPGAGLTSDGVPIGLQANILGAGEAGPAFACGAEGIGLFRSEMLFLDRDSAPGEEEQYQAYRQVLEAAAGRPVVLRLLDVGGDKPLPYLPLPPEANPYLGRRGVRWYALHPDLVRTQLRAAARASAHGDLRLMIPMVAEAAEIRAVRALMAEAAEAPLPLGIMVEVPAAALNLEALAREADFLCVGTNDLVQYLFAADRGDARVARASHDWHPATLRVLARIVAQASGRPLSLCGEMAGRPGLLPLLVGLGFRTLSLAPALLPEARRALARLDSARCRDLAERALASEDADAVEALLREGAGQGRTAELVTLDLIEPRASCASKEEAIKLLAERVAALGRARDPLALEEAAWERELTYATGVGFGFAVPHCKSTAVEIPSLAVLRLAEPVPWGSLDGLPVDCLLFLATPAGDGGQEHLRIFARLARKLMDPAFRDALRAAPSSQEILTLLGHQVITPI
ncbi:phosphoenolpyruvate--protein phosphotransferase [Mesoterricola silvestris]|uniref:phosphoenolpyruvate--protein phosphotransferase n=1 Tax=Mesoterricola silvestris TaxID=2927979 RepID=A0AA48KAE8_9BACT|nr:phosphoenolpyruvate--protein phosphotransferase [Mesoterricola silvestris]BDU74030.1 phosphoenolpyruvate--protein phosphotransferase [Mesoterricola silvestris]